MTRRGDLLIFVSYVPDGEGYREDGMDSKEPALVLAHKASGVSKAWVIGLSSAWKYCNPQGYPTTWCYQVTADIGNALGLGDTTGVRRQIWQAIGDYLPELLGAFEFEMVREARHGTPRSEGDVIVRVDGDAVAEFEMRH